MENSENFSRSMPKALKTEIMSCFISVILKNPEKMRKKFQGYKIL
jgi:hypothetical protein